MQDTKSTQKATAFLYPNSEQSENDVKKTIPFTSVTDVHMNSTNTMRDTTDGKISHVHALETMLLRPVSTSGKT